MKKTASLRLKLLLALLSAFLLAVWLLLDIPCLIRHFTGLICPACGMTRAWLAVFQLELGTAFRCHPLFWSIPIWVLFLFCDGRLFHNRRVNNWVLGILLAALLICYLIRLFCFLSGDLPL